METFENYKEIYVKHQLLNIYYWESFWFSIILKKNETFGSIIRPVIKFIILINDVFNVLLSATYFLYEVSYDRKSTADR